MSRYLIIPLTSLFACCLSLGLTARSVADDALGGDAPEPPTEHSNQDKGDPPDDALTGHSNQDKDREEDGGGPSAALPPLGTGSGEELDGWVPTPVDGFGLGNPDRPTQIWVEDLMELRGPLLLGLPSLPMPEGPPIFGGAPTGNMNGAGDLFDFGGGELTPPGTSPIGTGAPIPAPGVLGILGLGLLSVNRRRRRAAA